MGLGPPEPRICTAIGFAAQLCAKASERINGIERRASKQTIASRHMKAPLSIEANLGIDVVRTFAVRLTLSRLSLSDDPNVSYGSRPCENSRAEQLIEDVRKCNDAKTETEASPNCRMLSKMMCQPRASEFSHGLGQNEHMLSAYHSIATTSGHPGLAGSCHKRPCSRCCTNSCPMRQSSLCSWTQLCGCRFACERSADGRAYSSAAASCVGCPHRE